MDFLSAPDPARSWRIDERAAEALLRA